MKVVRAKQRQEGDWKQNFNFKLPDEVRGISRNHFLLLFALPPPFPFPCSASPILISSSPGRLKIISLHAKDAYMLNC